MYSIEPGDTPLLMVPVYDRSEDEHYRKVQERVDKAVPPTIVLDHVEPHMRETYRQVHQRSREQAREAVGSRWLFTHQIGCFTFAGDNWGNVFGYQYWQTKSLFSPYIKWPRCRVPYQLDWVGKTFQGKPEPARLEELAVAMRQAVEETMTNRYARGCWADWSFWRPVPVLVQWLAERDLP
jgi:hypothetical protein